MENGHEFFKLCTQHSANVIGIDLITLWITDLFHVSWESKTTLILVKCHYVLLHHRTGMSFKTLCTVEVPTLLWYSGSFSDAKTKIINSRFYIH